MIVGVTAARSSPGATSLTVGLAAAWVNLSGRALIVEADPSGGILRLRFDLPGNPSWASLSADLRRNRDPRVVAANSVDLDGLHCLTSPLDPVVAAAVLDRSAGPVAELLPSVGAPVAVDLGRVDRHSPTLPLAVAADVVLVVFRPRLDEIQSALYATRLLRSVGAEPALVTIGDRPHHPSEVADLAGVELVAALPDDPVMAVAFSGGRYNRGRLRRSTLWRALVSLGRVTLAGSTLLDRSERPEAPERPVVPERPVAGAEPEWPAVPDRPVVPADPGVIQWVSVRAAPVPPAPPERLAGSVDPPGCTRSPQPWPPPPHAELKVAGGHPTPNSSRDVGFEGVA